MSSIRFNTVNSESDLHINDISSNGIALVSGGGNVNIGSNTIGSKKLTVTGDFHVTNSAASTSSSTGSITTPGGIGISNTTNASSVSNGGSFTTAGGIAVAKDIYSGQSLFVTGTSQVSTTDNTITGVEGTINTQGDLVLYNGTKNTVVFREVGIAAPSLTNRSAGTKLVLYPNTTASTTDYAIGMNTTSMWFSVDTDADSHKFNFYQATNNVANIGRLGIDLYASDRPLVTRRHDTFTSGTYSGVGRWGLFMEPGAITIGKPTGAGKNFKVSNYNADSTKSDLLTVNESGDLSLTSTTASTNTSTGSITTSGGIGISNTTNASSTTNGGSFTTAGGIAVAKDIYSGQSLFVTGTSQVSTTDNAITGVEGTINTQGDLVLYNGTKNTVVFREVGIAAPSLTNRSAGTKLVLYPNTTASTTDYAIGMNTTSMWFSVDTDADSHKFNFYQATNNVANIGRLGIDLYAADFPLVTRRHDTFTSGTYSGVGRWGLFMEPGAITIGKPTGAGKNFKVSNYNADSTKSDLLTVNDSGDLSLTSTTASTNTTTGSITTPGGVGIGGNLNVGGALAKGSGTFDIPHPNPAKEVMGYRLRHSFVESPTAGDNLYRFAYYIENFLEFSLPEYFGYLNCNVSCWVSCCDSFGIGYGKFIKNSENDCKIKVIVSIPGTYNILVIGTRKDKVAVGNWSSKNIEYRGC